MGPSTTYFLMTELVLMQHTSISPDRRILTVVGDHTEGLLVDSQSGKVKKVLLMWYWIVFFVFFFLFISQLQILFLRRSVKWIISVAKLKKKKFYSFLLFVPCRPLMWLSHHLLSFLQFIFLWSQISFTLGYLLVSSSKHSSDSVRLAPN